MSNSQITAKQFVDDDYQTCIEKRACNVYWDQFNVDSVILYEGDYVVRYGDCATAAVATYTRFNVRWHSEEEFLIKELDKAETALAEAKDTLRLIHDIAQSARNHLIGDKSADEYIVTTLKNIDMWAFKEYQHLLNI